MFRYKLLGKKGEGTFSEVIKAQNIETGSFHAIKCMKQRFANVDEVWMLTKGPNIDDKVLLIVRFFIDTFLTYQYF